MITVTKLKAELDKFPDEALCFAYEGEVRGIVIEHDDALNQGVIFCSENDDYDLSNNTELLIFKDGA